MKRRVRVLVVEDSVTQIGQILDVVRQAGFEPRAVTSLQEAREAFTKTTFEVLLADIHLTSSAAQATYEGLELLDYVRNAHPEVLPLTMSSDPKIETYKRALAKGARHFFRKPILSPDEFAIGVEAARAHAIVEKAARLGRSSVCLPEEILRLAPDGVLLPSALRSVARKVALSRSIPVVIHGETGTGKEEVAKLIHRNRVEIEGALPFVAVNCANLTGDLAAPLLFGHKKGAFTGATETTNGFVGEADGGILFLDEVHALPMTCQQRILRVLNDGSYERVGDTKSTFAEFQVITASTRDLDDEVDGGRFLLDLRMRLTGVDIHLPPLRERMGDLPALVALFFARESISLPPDEVEKIATRCAGYQWKGNIRQLFKVLQSLAVMASFNGDAIRAEDLPVFRSMVEDVAGERSVVPTLGVRGLPADALSTLRNLLDHDVPLEETMDVFERMKLQATMARHDKIGDVAKALQLARSTLDVKRKKHGL